MQLLRPTTPLLLCPIVSLRLAKLYTDDGRSCGCLTLATSHLIVPRLSSPICHWQSLLHRPVPRTVVERPAVLGSLPSFSFTQHWTVRRPATLCNALAVAWVERSTGVKRCTLCFTLYSFSSLRRCRLPTFLFVMLSICRYQSNLFLLSLSIYPSQVLYSLVSVVKRHLYLLTVFASKRTQNK